jgi:Holliday junction resolvase RusA-like endonuclease
MIELVVYGSPAPQGSKKFVGTTPTGKGLLVESSKKVRPWRMDVKAAAQALLHANPQLRMLDCPLQVAMVFTLPKPASLPKTRRSWPMRKPDVSKLARSTEDALSDAGLWADDARVVEYSRLAKVFPNEDPDALASPGVLIRIWPMGETRSSAKAQTTLLPTPLEEAAAIVDEVFP